MMLPDQYIICLCMIVIIKINRNELLLSEANNLLALQAPLSQLS